MNKKFKPKELIWSVYALIIAILIHLYAPNYLFIQAWKYVALFSVVINICTAFSVKVPYITDNKKLPKNYNIYAGIIAFILYITYSIYFQK